MSALRLVKNEPIFNFEIDEHDPIRDGLALMIKNGWSFPNELGDAPLLDNDGLPVIAGEQFWCERAEYIKAKCKPFLDHLALIMGNDERDKEIFLDYMAYKQQYAGVKIRWAIVLAGEQGLGKDVSIDACWHEYGLNFINNVSPDDILSPFNDFVKCMLLRISEVADLKEGNRWTFNEHLKVLIAGHPDDMLINAKYGFKTWAKLYNGTILTTNHLDSGIFIPKGDRRMYVIKCTDMEQIGLKDVDKRIEYFDNLFKWFKTRDEHGITGYEYLGNYLFWCRNVEKFNPNICPKNTAAKDEVIQASNPIPDFFDDALLKYTEMLERLNLGGILPLCDKRNYPVLIFCKKLSGFITENKSAKSLAYLLKNAGYVKLKNPSDTTDGKFRLMIDKKRYNETIYVLKNYENNQEFFNNLVQNLGYYVQNLYASNIEMF